MMMNLILSLTLIWTVSCTAEPLQCWQNSQNGTLEFSPCSSTELCGTATFKVSSLLGNVPESIRKLCLPPSPLSEGKHTFSISAGFVSISASVHECNTDGCNNQTISSLDLDQKENNLLCFGCDPHSLAVCNQTVECVGVEDRCFSGTVSVNDETFGTFGCVSANLCENLSHLELLPVRFTHLPKCCKGRYCNSAWSVKLNVITLLFGLFTLILY